MPTRTSFWRCRGDRLHQDQQAEGTQRAQFRDPRRPLGAAGELRCNDAVRVVIVTGEGNKAFVAGADIQEMQPMSPMEEA